MLESKGFYNWQVKFTNGCQIAWDTAK